MDPQRWGEIERLYHLAREQEAGKREKFLTEACGGDEPLRREVESLLARPPERQDFLEAPALEVAAKALAKDQLNALPPELTGRTIAHYRVLEKIGEGGMGVVYRAEDSRLKRSVAIKLLPHDKMADPERKKRFVQEARAASALNHPNIITIHDIGSADGIDFIAMEYMAGRPLSQLIGDRRLRLEETLNYGIQIACALEVAHKAGIIHRDLKPSNVMVTEDGRVKVLDFGLAKLADPAESAGPGESIESLTASGSIVGTAAYMSPEQAQGKLVDARSDIFAFGAVLYEMVTGRRAFKGDSNISTLAAVLRAEPEPINSLAGRVPLDLERMIARCLKKDPERRFQHVDEVRVSLEELKQDPAKHIGLKPIYWVAAAALAMLCAGAWTFLRLVSREAVLAPPTIAPLTDHAGIEGSPALSPDGRWVAYSWGGEKNDNTDIYVKEVDGTGFNRLTADPAVDCDPVWSPDGRQIAFLRSPVGGSSIFTQVGSSLTIFLISPLGGREQKLAEYTGHGPISWSPDGTSIAMPAQTSAAEPWSIWSLDVNTREKKKLTNPGLDPGFGDGSPAYSPDGRFLAFVRFGTGFTVQLLVMRLPGGEPQLVTDFKSPQSICWTADSKEIVYVGSEPWSFWRVPVGGGEPRRIPERGDNVGAPSISGQRLAYASTVGKSEIWKLDLARKGEIRPPSKPLVAMTSDKLTPDISPDGRRIAFAGGLAPQEIWVCNSDGSQPVRLTDMKAEGTTGPRWSPDGKLIAFVSVKQGNYDVYLVPAEGGPVLQLTKDASQEFCPSWSRDGRWVYFGSDRSGAYQIWRMPSGGGKAIQVTTGGGFEAEESLDGHYLYYCKNDTPKGGIWRVPVSAGSETFVTDAVTMLCWALTVRGIYFHDPAEPQPKIRFYDFATRGINIVAPESDEPAFWLPIVGISVSRDGKWLLYCGQKGASNILMMDNFR